VRRPRHQAIRRLRFAPRGLEICVLQQGDAQVQVRDPEVGFASKGLPKRRRSFVELELLEEGDAEIVRAIGLLARGDDRRGLTAEWRGGEQQDGSGDLRPETHGIHPVPVEWPLT